MSDIEVNARVRIPADEVRVAFSRSSGPGGQNVNKVASKVELRWTPATSSALGLDDRARVLMRLGGRLTLRGELIVTSSLTRDQHINRSDAEQKLASLVRAALHREKPRRPTKPSRASKARRVQAKRVRSAIKSNRGRASGDD